MDKYLSTFLFWVTMQISAKIFRFFRSLIVYFIIFIVIYSLVNWWRQPVMPANPTLQFITIDNQSIDLRYLSEQKPVLVYFWGSWCGICRQTSPSVNLLALSADYPVITIAVNSGNKEEIQQYLIKNQWQFMTVNDIDGQIFANWQGKVTPSYVILQHGEMKQGLTGLHPAWELKLRMWLLEKFA